MTLDSPATSAPQAPPGHAGITWVEISNYRSIGENVRVDFGAFTALVGLNGSGKSSILDALRLVRDALIHGLPQELSRRFGFDRVRRAGLTCESLRIRVGVRTPQGSNYTYALDLAPRGRGGYSVSTEAVTMSDENGGSTELLLVHSGIVHTAPPGLAPLADERSLVLPSVASHPLMRPLSDALKSVRVYNFNPADLRALHEPGVIPYLDDDGTNWAGAWAYLPDSAKADLLLGLNHVNPEIVDLKATPALGQEGMEFKHEVGGETAWFTAAQESDGTLRLTAILLALLQDPAPAFIAIEEPELTVNPGMLPLLVTT